MVIPVKVGLWSVLLIGCYCLWNFSKRDIVSKLFKFGRQIYLAFLLYLGLHILCTKLMVTGSRAQYQINGWYLSLKNVFFVRVAAHAASVITAFTCLFP